MNEKQEKDLTAIYIHVIRNKMKLQTYIEFKKIPVVQAAIQLKIKRQYLYAILAGKEIPGRKLAIRIKAWSDNAVDYQDLWE